MNKYLIKMTSVDENDEKRHVSQKKSEKKIKFMLGCSQHSYENAHFYCFDCRISFCSICLISHHLHSTIDKYDYSMPTETLVNNIVNEVFDKLSYIKTSYPQYFNESLICGSKENSMDNKIEEIESKNYEPKSKGGEPFKISEMLFKIEELQSILKQKFKSRGLTECKLNKETKRKLNNFDSNLTKFRSTCILTLRSQKKGTETSEEEDILLLEEEVFLEIHNTVLQLHKGKASLLEYLDGLLQQIEKEQNANLNQVDELQKEFFSEIEGDLSKIIKKLELFDIESLVKSKNESSSRADSMSGSILKKKKTTINESRKKQSASIQSSILTAQVISQSAESKNFSHSKSSMQLKNKNKVTISGNPEINPSLSNHVIDEKFDEEFENTKKVDFEVVPTPRKITSPKLDYKKSESTRVGSVQSSCRSRAARVLSLNTKSSIYDSQTKQQDKKTITSCSNLYSRINSNSKSQSQNHIILSGKINQKDSKSIQTSAIKSTSSSRLATKMNKSTSADYYSESIKSKPNKGNLIKSPPMVTHSNISKSVSITGAVPDDLKLSCLSPIEKNIKSKNTVDDSVSDSNASYFESRFTSFTKPNNFQFKANDMKFKLLNNPLINQGKQINCTTHNFLRNDVVIMKRRLEKYPEIMSYNPYTSKFESLIIDITEESKIKKFYEFSIFLNVNNSIFVSGGKKKNKKLSKLFLKFNYLSNELLRLPDMIEPRCSHSLIYHEERQEIFVVGGYGLKTCEKYSIEESKWSLISPMNYVRQVATLLFVNRRYLIAAFGFTSDESFEEVEFFEKLDIESSNLEKSDVSIWEMMKVSTSGISGCLRIFNTGVISTGLNNFLICGGETFKGEETSDVYLLSFNCTEGFSIKPYSNGKVKLPTRASFIDKYFVPLEKGRYVQFEMKRNNIICFNINNSTFKLEQCKL